MLNYELPYLPKRSVKPREKGITMVMDKGLSVRQAEELAESASEYIDYVKFGFGTSLITKYLQNKVDIYKQAGIKVYFGGTLFEAFIVRGMFDEFRKYIKNFKLDVLEVSDGSIELPHEEKLGYIEKLSAEFEVLSEVGSKQAGVYISENNWLKMMKNELNVGAKKVIAEARESGNIGIYNSNGSANSTLIQEIIDHVGDQHVIWEAPVKRQQVWFIRLLGPSVNLGNIDYHEVISLETLRLGLRGDTFFEFLPEELLKYKQTTRNLDTEFLDYQI